MEPNNAHYFSADMQRYRALELAIRASDGKDTPMGVVARAEKFLDFLAATPRASASV